jgi:hypothetical protein
MIRCRNSKSVWPPLAALGPMEFEPGEREATAQALAEIDRLGRDDMQRINGTEP